jgi:hypothetical protein
MSESKLAKREVGAISPRQQIGAEIALRETGDEEYRFQLRKLGNIHLGVKVHGTGARANGQNYEYDRPVATEYFVMPDKLREDKRFRAKLDEMGEDPDKPKQLPIMLLSNDLKAAMVTSCDLYGQNGKLKCRKTEGNGCVRLNETSFEYEPAECVQTDACKGCAWYHRFRFAIIYAGGLGYWQIVTKSDNNHAALLMEIATLRNARRGRVAGVELLLSLTNEREFHVPMKQNGKIILGTTSPYLLHIESSWLDVLNAQQVGETYDAEIIEQDYEQDDAPDAEEDFVLGEQAPVNVDPKTGEIIGPIESSDDADYDPLAEEAEDPVQSESVCAECHQPITPAISGRTNYTVEQVVEITTKRTGAPKCFKCFANAKKGQAAA